MVSRVLYGLRGQLDEGRSLIEEAVRGWEQDGQLGDCR